MVYVKRKLLCRNRKEYCRVLRIRLACVVHYWIFIKFIFAFTDNGLVETLARSGGVYCVYVALKHSSRKGELAGWVARWVCLQLQNRVGRFPLRLSVSEYMYRALSLPMAPSALATTSCRIETIYFICVLFSSIASLCFFIPTYNLSCNLYEHKNDTLFWRPVYVIIGSSSNSLHMPVNKSELPLNINKLVFPKLSSFFIPLFFSV